MSDVTVINHKQLNSSQLEVLEKFKAFQQAMIDKDAEKLNELMDDDYTLTHMSGKVQTKQEYIDDIINGVLNYYHSTIIEPEINILDEKHARFDSDVELDAKVYGIKGTWTLNTCIFLKRIDDGWIMSKWDN